MAKPLFDFAGGPAYLRFMSLSGWGEAGDPKDKRVKAAVASFDKDKHKPTFSFYLVRSDEEAILAAIAFVRGRIKPLERSVAAVPFTEDDIALAVLAGATVNPTDGGIICPLAARTHRDLTMQAEAVAALCASGIGKDRPLVTITKAELG